MSLAHHHRSDVDLDDKVDSAIILVLVRRQIRQRWRIAGRPEKGGNAIRLQGFPRHDPRRDRRCEALRQERSEWLILPRLDVARRPVVDKADAEQVLFGVPDADWLRKLVALSNEESDLSLVVEHLRRPELRSS